jgi:hypothetical protein
LLNSQNSRIIQPEKLGLQVGVHPYKLSEDGFVSLQSIYLKIKNPAGHGLFPGCEKLYIEKLAVLSTSPGKIVEMGIWKIQQTPIDGNIY